MELDEFLCLSFPLLNKGFLRRQVRDGRILVDGNKAVPSQRLRTEFEAQGLSADITPWYSVPAEIRATSSPVTASRTGRPSGGAVHCPLT